ncbi:beta-galactosidase trimerization domain protein [Marvinbryantia formatexigens DSM 14469]|uniref:Beta-galactosidase n=1 Tax=Marvinbryantia formatexigens DSM 14469 TaxID=478749 RepID=C6LHJ8_9FIRM|nr:beta-galactosidase [Marvinbryantia formatexigens]EET59985.1 beta-galactosidase trimerization domain protein [Marvinbryantia formatexigens DSM 14469]UWO25860.1 beta-galactosidase [Marvinbryantia formatexigens DSM 14469]SDF40476.1 beta-galactosidase [Marvinbryantia formatexigens]
MAYGKKIKKILYGGDYNPEQWPEEVWQEDVRLMKKAHINMVTLNVFSWAALQPDEDVYDFEKLDKIMELMRSEGFLVCLATSTGAHPAWMARRHPDILRTDAEGRKRRFGGRHNSCPNSPTYRHYAAKLAGKLAERYRDYDNIVAWHISNEFGGECYCENCERAFREWLKKKYGTVENMNRAFYTAFWGHTFYDWDEVVPPNFLSEHFRSQSGEERTMFQGISLDYRRFNSDSMLECFCLERDAIRRVMPQVPVTTNLMGFYKPLDYQKWAKEMDFVSWDSYPHPEDSPAEVALNHDLMRGIGGQDSFVLMEQTPSVTNWHPYNRLKRPGEMRLLSYQAAAHGADAIQFFQIRRTMGACEKFHGAVIDHAGREDTRVFREITQLGAELETLQDVFLEGRTPSEVGILFDWDNWWAVEYSAGPSVRMKYLDAVKDYYTAAFSMNVPVDIIGAEDALTPYKVVIAPLLYMCKSGVAERIRSFVENGGIFITTYFSGIVDEHDLVYPGGYPGPLRDVLGIWVEENDALPDGEENCFVYEGAQYPAAVLCDLMHLCGAEALASYGRDFYQGTPVITKNTLGSGCAYYVGTRSDAAFYRHFLKNIFRDAGVQPPVTVPEGVEAAVRGNDRNNVLFLLNHTGAQTAFAAGGAWENLLTGETYQAGQTLVLEKNGVLVLKNGG